MFLIFLIAVCIMVISIIISRGKKTSNNISQYLINEFIKRNNSTVTKAINIPGYDNRGYFFIDDNKKCVNYLVWNKSNPKELFAKTFLYKDILKCELIKDGKTALVHDVFSFINRMNKKEYVKKLGIRITFNDLSFPYLDILFLNKTVGVTLTGLGSIVRSTNEWLTTLNIVIERGKTQKIF